MKLLFLINLHVLTSIFGANSDEGLPDMIYILYIFLFRIRCWSFFTITLWVYNSIFFEIFAFKVPKFAYVSAYRHHFFLPSFLIFHVIKNKNKRRFLLYVFYELLLFAFYLLHLFFMILFFRYFLLFQTTTNKVFWIIKTHSLFLSFNTKFQ